MFRFSCKQTKINVKNLYQRASVGMLQWWCVGVMVVGLGASSQYLTYPGDIMLGGLVPIHKQGEHGLTCGGIQDEDGIQPLEALLFTLDEINADPLLLPNIKLGVIVLDTCDNPLHGAEVS